MYLMITKDYLMYQHYNRSINNVVTILYYFNNTRTLLNPDSSESRNIRWYRLTYNTKKAFLGPN